MNILPLTTEGQWAWFSSLSHAVLCGDTHGFIMFNDSGTPQAAVVFDTVTPEAMNVHMVVENPMALRHGLLQTAAEHAFLKRGKKRLFGLVPDNNQKALKLNKHIGWREVTRIPDAIREGVGIVVMRIDKEGCRWLPEIKEEAA